jgi:hypothetical protein
MAQFAEGGVQHNPFVGPRPEPLPARIDNPLYLVEHVLCVVLEAHASLRAALDAKGAWVQWKVPQI